MIVQTIQISDLLNTQIIFDYMSSSQLFCAYIVLKETATYAAELNIAVSFYIPSTNIISQIVFLFYCHSSGKLSGNNWERSEVSVSERAEQALPD